MQVDLCAKAKEAELNARMLSLESQIHWLGEQNAQLQAELVKAAGSGDKENAGRCACAWAHACACEECIRGMGVPLRACACTRVDGWARQGTGVCKSKLDCMVGQANMAAGMHARFSREQSGSGREKMVIPTHMCSACACASEASVAAGRSLAYITRRPSLQGMPLVKCKHMAMSAATREKCMHAPCTLRCACSANLAGGAAEAEQLAELGRKCVALEADLRRTKRAELKLQALLYRWVASQMQQLCSLGECKGFSACSRPKVTEDMQNQGVCCGSNVLNLSALAQCVWTLHSLGPDLLGWVDCGGDAWACP